ncbi:MAG: type I polyketide synthase, partial [Chloroflexi bacterium]|nr:type I polyketide synthase [Chloroflexota bacterium]
MTTAHAMNGNTKSLSANHAEPIAIIGIGCRLPGGVTSPASFWQLLEQGVDAITEIPTDRWNIQKFFDPEPSKPGHTYVKWGGFVDKIDQFDAQFFGISPREAAVMDPQHRMLLETTWEALEDGGQVPAQLAGSSTGVFIGIFMRDYEQLMTSTLNRQLLNNHTGVGSAMSIAANRISYVFDFVGPSVALDTACSSSLIAVHLACQSLRNGECTLAVAGGASLLLRPENTIATSKASMLSPDGRCKSFDARANGYVRSEGCGVVVLKPLAQAVADGDPIYAVIRGSATNQDGRSNGLTVPNGRAQEAALRTSLQQAGVKSEQVQYVEAHGTGTFVGDPIETNALGNVLGKARPTPCLIGSVKSNIGHLEATAGVAGLIKTALALKHRQIPANLHFETPNPQISFRDLNLQVPTSLMPWPEPAYGSRFASVNSFGFGGANANVVLEEAPSLGDRETRGQGDKETDSPLLLPLSARSPEALHAVVQAYRDDLAKGEATLADICYSAALRRGHHNYRAAFVASSTTAMAEQLTAFLADETGLTIASGQVVETPIQLAFVYAGMGTQWWAMGRQLFQDEPIFREAVLAVDRLLQPLAGWSLIDALLAEEAASQIQQTNIAQPAIFAVQVGLTALWRAWGLVPTAIVGHSVGEIAAAYAAGALSLADAVLVIYQRSRLQHTTAGLGTMLAVGLSASAVTPYLADYTDVVSIGAINSPTSVTLAGDSAALKAIGAALDAQNIFNRFLQVEVPYHSPQMEPIRAELIASLAPLTPQAATIPLYSTVTGNLIDGATLTGEYWWRNVRQPVRFADAIAHLHHAGSTHFLEVSPHPVLVRSVQECLKAETGAAAGAYQVLASLRREQPEWTTLLGTLGQLYALGYPLAWTQLVQGHFVRLPSYPWQRERYWLESDVSMQDRLDQSTTGQSSITRGASSHPLLGGELNLAPAVRVWEGELDRRHLGYLDDHRVQNTIIYPGAGYLEMALAVAAQAGAPGQIAQVVFHKALPLAPSTVENAAPRFQVVLAGDTIDIYSQAQQSDAAPSWVHHATSKLQRAPATPSVADLALHALRKQFAQPIEQTQCYQQFRALGLNYGPAFQGITQLWRAPGEALAELHLHESIAATQTDYQLHPVLLDLCLQTFLGVMAADVADQAQPTVFLPVQIDQIIIHQPLEADEPLYCYAR